MFIFREEFRSSKTTQKFGIKRTEDIIKEDFNDKDADMPFQVVKEVTFEDVFSPMKYPGIDDSEFIIKNVTFNESQVDFSQPLLHDDPEIHLTPFLKTQCNNHKFTYLVPISTYEEEEKTPLPQTSCPECLKPIISYLLSVPDLLSASIFTIDDQSDTLIYNQNNFTFYSKFLSSYYKSPESLFLSSLLSKDNFPCDLSQYLLLKTSCLLPFSINTILSLLSPSKYPLFNPHLSSLEEVLSLPSMNAGVYR